jgi:AraC-like DNA-binding protein
MNPLPTYSAKALWKKAVEASNEPAKVKAVLKRIGRHLNHEGRRSSISVTQIASDTKMSRSSVSRVLRAVNGVWLVVEFNKGIKRSTGRENLYHARLPEALDIAGTNCGKACQTIVARHVGTPEAVTQVHSKTVRQTVDQGRTEGIESGVPAPNVIDFAAARERMRTVLHADRRAAL